MQALVLNFAEPVDKAKQHLKINDKCQMQHEINQPFAFFKPAALFQSDNDADTVHRRSYHQQIVDDCQNHYH